MDKIKKGLLIITSCIMLLLTGLVVTSCGENANAGKITLNATELTMVLNQEDNSKIVTAVKEEGEFSIFYILSNTDVVKVENAENAYNYNRYKITPLSEGDVTVTFVSSENSAVRASVVVHVTRVIEQMQFTRSEDVYVAVGSTYKLKSSEFNVYPQVSIFDQAQFSVEENNFGVSITSDGLIDATQATSECRVQLNVTSKFNSDIKISKYISVISPINASTSVDVKDSANAIYYTQGEQVQKIELVKSDNERSYKILSVTVAGANFSDLTYSCAVSGQSVQALVSGGELTLQSVNIGESTIDVFVVQTKAINYFEPIKISLKVNVIELPTMLILNGGVITNEAHYVYDYYDEGAYGFPLNIQAYPSATQDDKDLIQLNFDAPEYFKLLKKVGSDASELDISSGEIVVNANDDLYLQAVNIDSLVDSSFTIGATSLLAKEYGLDVNAQIKLELKKGIKAIAVQDEVRLKVGQSTEELFITVEPANADASGVELRCSSNKISVVKLSANSYRITANALSDSNEYVYFSKPNGGEIACRVVIFESLQTLSIEVDDVLSGKVSQKNYVTQNVNETDVTVLDNVVVKMGQAISLFVLYNQGATISQISVTAVNLAGGNSGITIARDYSNFECFATGDYVLTVRVNGFDDDGLDLELTQNLRINCYKAITSFTISKNNALCYTANSVGYYNEANLSSVKVNASVTPIDAKFASNIEWSLADETGTPLNPAQGFITPNGGFAEFKAIDIDTDSLYVIVTATVQQYSEKFVVSCRVQITKAVKVNQIVATNVPNQNLYFDSRKGLNSANATRFVNTFQIKTSVYPTNALNKKVVYEYRTLNNEITSDAICSITNDGTVIPHKAGKCQILICAEDSYTSSTQALTYAVVYVTIQDGKSLQTAFHVTNESELLAIGQSAESMSYYYILTQNINMQSSTEIGASSSALFTMPFTGYLTGRVAYRYGNSVVESENPEIVSYYSIYGLKLNYKPNNGYSNPASAVTVNVGLFSTLGVIASSEYYEGSPLCGTVEDLTINYSSFVVDLSNRNTVRSGTRDATIYNIGGLCGSVALNSVNSNPIKNVKVSYNTNGAHQVKLGICTTFVGGIIGNAQNCTIRYFDGIEADENNVDHNYLCRGAVVSGKELEIQIVNPSFADVTGYAGGIVGRANNVILNSRYYGINNNNAGVSYSSSFGDDYIDVTMNISLKLIDSTYQEIYVNDIEPNFNVGGVFGEIQVGQINNVAVENVINAINNVGGFAGRVIGGVSINNSFACGKINAINNIGGFVGVVQEGSTLTINASYLQNYDDGEKIDSELILLSGLDNVGGMVGLSNGTTNLTNCYTSSYITRPNFVGDVYSTNQNAHLGGLVGYASSGVLNINKCYTNFLLNITYNNSESQAFAFYQANSTASVNITNCYIINSSVSGADPTLTGLKNGYYANTSDGTVKLYIYKTDGSVEEVDFDSIALIQAEQIIAHLNSSENGEEVFAIIDGELPYLIYNGNGLVELAPQSVQITSVAGATSKWFTLDGEKVLVLEYYKALDNSNQAQLNSLNTSLISNYLDMQSIPTDGYIKRYVTTSDNNEVVSFSFGGEIVVNGVGETLVTIKSKLNYLKQDVIRIVVIYASNGFSLYDNGAHQVSPVTNISIYKDQTKQIYPTIASYTYRQGQANEVQTRVEDNIYVEFKFKQSATSSEYISDVSSYLTLANNAKVNSIFDIKALDECHIYFEANVYIIVKEQKVYLKDIFAKFDELNNPISYTTPLVDFSINLGATSIQVVGSNQIKAQAGDTITTTIRAQTTNANDGINFGIYNDNGEMVANCSYEPNGSLSFTNSRNLFNDVVITFDNSNYSQSSYLDYTISLSLKGRAREISQNVSYSVRVSPQSNANLLTLYSIEFYPATIDRIQSAYYTYGLRKVQGNTVELNSNESARDMILPGTTGMLIIDVAPYYSNYDYIEVTCQNNLTFMQNLYRPNISFPYVEHTNISYLTNGIRLANVYYDNSGLKYGKNGRYYVSVVAPIDTLIKQYTIKISAYKVVNGQTVTVLSTSKVLDCENLPVVKLSYRGESSSEVQDIYIPKGIEDELGVELYNMAGEPVITIATVEHPDITYNFVTVYKDGDKYKININKNASVGDNVLITFTCYKQVGEELKQTQSSIQFILVPYLITDLGFELVDNGVMHEQFGGNFKLALSVEKSSLIYDESDPAILAQIQSDFKKISGYDYNSWYAYRQNATGADYSIGSYYENEYLTIKTLSSISKDLYVSGNYYDEFDNYQKYLGVNLKYYFDKSSNCYIFSKLIKSNSRTNLTPYSFASSKVLQNGRYYFEQSKFFFVSFYMNTSLDNAKPIYNVQEFQEMQAGMSYVLMRNLELANFVPITAQIAYLNGNGKTITLTSFNTQNSSNIGIFESLANNAIVENLSVVIANTSLDVDAQGKSNVVYGTIVANNYGKLYNCSISYSGSGKESDSTTSTIIGGVSYTGSSDWVNGMREGKILTYGINVQITVTSENDTATLVTSTMGALCGYNSGYITNCRVESGVNFNGYGVMGGLVGHSTGTIASSYSKAKVNSYSTVQSNSAVAGFVGKNSGVINLSYAEHMNSASNTNGIYSGNSVGINSATTASGFVHTNSGSIGNCYANLRVSSSASSAGFVFDNTNGTIDNCYSACFVRENSKRDMAFVGVDSYNQINSDEKAITNCYFMRGNYANQDTQIAKAVERGDFASYSTFTTFAFSSKDKTTNGFTSAGVWMIPTSVSGEGSYVGQSFISGMPTLVSANQISKGYVELLSSSRGEDGNPEYKYSALIGAQFGSVDHPYVIYSTADLNKYIQEGTSSSDKTNNKFYVLASDISFREQTKMAQTYYVNFKGTLNGNGMQISSLRISYVNIDSSSLDSTNFGLFKSLNGATIQNLNFDVQEVYGSVVQNVGVLAGTISNSYIYNINLNGDAVVQGKNIVGALAGVVGAYDNNGNHVNDNSEIKNITSSLTVNATYKQTTSIRVGDDVNSYNTYSYGGGLFGLIASNQSLVENSNKIANLKVQDGARVLGDVVGGIAGYIGANRAIEHASVVVDADMYLRGTTSIGGIAGVNQGTINYASVQYTEEVQSVLDNVQSVYNNGAKANVGEAQAVSNNNFFNYSSFGTYVQNGVIGGVVGILAKGEISNSYNKVNIVSKNACIMGGIAGQALGGKINYCYTSCVVDGTLRSSSSDVRIVGGVVGLAGTNATSAVLSYFVGLFSDEEDKTLTLNNVVSISTFNKNSYNSYIYQVKNADDSTSTFKPMIIGGVIGALDYFDYNESKCLVEATNVYYNAYAYEGFNATKDNGSDLLLNSIGAVPKENKGEQFNTYYFTINNIEVEVQSVPVTLVNAFGERYICLVSDGIKNVQGDYYSYTSFDSEGKVVGRKTEVFAPFVIEGYFAFDSEDDSTPVIKQIESTATLQDLFTLSGDNIYLQGADLYKVALITQSAEKNGSIWADINGFSGYTLILNTNMVLNSSWPSFAKFRGTFNGNGKQIDFAQVPNSTGFINNAGGAIIKNVTFTNLNIGSNKVGLINNASSIRLDLVSCYVNSITDVSAIDNVGVIANNLTGTGIFNRSYVVFDNGITTDNLVSAFVGECLGNVKIQTCYSRNSADAVISFVGELKSSYTATITNSVLYNNTSSEANFIKTNNGTLDASYSYVKNASDGLSQTFFKTNDNWFLNGENQSPYNQDVWFFEENAIFPRHTFDPNRVIVYDGIGDYDEATKTYTLHNSLNLLNLANAINSGTIANGGYGYTFVLDTNVDGLHYVKIGEENYYIYDFDGTSSGNIIYSDGIEYAITINSDDVGGVDIAGLEVNEQPVKGTHITSEIPSIGTEANPFRGIFNGTGHEIKNITFTGSVGSTGTGYAGMFGKVIDATIKGFSLINCNAVLNNGSSIYYIYAGCVVGVAYSSEISEVSVGYGANTTKITIQASNQNGTLYAGGIIGFAQTITIKNVFVNAQLTFNTSSYKIGKLVGYLIRNQAFIKNVYYDINNPSSQANEPNINGITGYYGEAFETNNDVYEYNYAGTTNP